MRVRSQDKESQMQKRADACTDEEALRQNIIEGCREMWDVNVEIEQEFHPLEEEVAHANPAE